MSEETKIQCPACTAELTPETVECPWCGRLMTPKAEEKPSEEAPERIRDWFEPEPAPVPSEPAPIPLPAEPDEPLVPEEPIQPPLPSELPEPVVPTVAVFPVAEPGLTEIAPVPGRAPASNLKMMGIILTIFSFLALLFFAFQVFQEKLPPLVLVVPIFGMMIGLISIMVGQKR